MVYLDHSQLAGDELELVKIANLAAEHQNDGDEQAYFSLFDSKRDPNMKMASYKITKMLLESVSVKSETSALIVALVTTVENGENTRLYSFIKENGKWKITDID
ncbi:hypothetical protein E6C60_0806 [Paenibacillus algicola]|uniref:DUF4878 domain-containing protein n=1 Tax=Paenibacillus algicola TaxID=2565926 RepID=A0A4P8XGB4_9BACL|nr:hypothetical protein E6C60_0806 [Paenibacillus algicola]